jgi:hypothetical protein
MATQARFGKRAASQCVHSLHEYVISGRWRRLGAGMLRTKLLAMTALCGAFGLLLTGETAAAADLTGYTAPPPMAQLPAVDGVNGKLDAFGGGYNRGAIGGMGGSLSLPLGQSFGTQIDGLGADLGGSAYGSIADHLFWRNPSAGLIGLYGNYAHYDGASGVNIVQGAAEGEAYINNFTIRALAGVEGGNSGTFNFGTQKFNVQTRFFDKVNFEYYATENTRFYVGHRYQGGINAAAAGAEQMFHTGGGMAVSAYVEGRLGEDNYKAIWGGIRVYFGGADKSLIRRSREDDPGNWEPDSLFSLSSNVKTTPATPAPAPPPPAKPPAPPPT